jgi:hypothetical protein
LANVSKFEIRKFSNFAPLAQSAEQVTLNHDHRWVISPVLPNTLPKCLVKETPVSKNRYKPTIVLRLEERSCSSDDETGKAALESGKKLNKIVD